MKNKRRTNILVYTLAVMALLLRPYFAYQLTESRQLTKDPVALNNLLQRLIKKKDDHHASDAVELSAILFVQNKIPPQLPQAGLTIKPLSGYLSITKFTAPLRTADSSTAYYKLFSVFRI